MPVSANRVSVGVSIRPPNVLGCPKPASSSMTIRMLGASSGRCRGCVRHLWTDSCIVGPTLPPIGGEGKGSKETVLVKEFQRDAITSNLLHIDFLRIKMEEEIETSVPVHILNEDIAIGIKEKSGVLQHGLREFHVSCLPADIPDYIEYDIAELDMGSAVRVADVKVADKIKVLNDPEEVVVSIIHPTQLKEEEEEEEKAEEEVEEAREPEVIGKGKEEKEPEEGKGQPEAKSSSEK